MVLLCTFASNRIADVELASRNTVETTTMTTIPAISRLHMAGITIRDLSGSGFVEQIFLGIVT